MAVSRASIPHELLPGLAGVEGRYPQIPKQYPQVFWRGYSKMALERAAENRYTGLAQLKSEGGATVFDNAPGERFMYNIEMIALGLGTALTREMLDDNLYKDQFGPMTMGLAESFAQTEEILHANIFNSGTVFNPSVMGDNQPLFSTLHPIDAGVYANRPTPDIGLNEAGLEYMLQLIRVFPDQAGLRMFARGERLIVPIALEWTAERLLNAELRPGTNQNDPNAVRSSGALPKGYQVMDFLSSPTAWFIKSTIAGLVSYERIPFELDLQVDPVTGNLLIIGYQRYGIGWRNPRGIVGSYPTA